MMMMGTFDGRMKSFNQTAPLLRLLLLLALVGFLANQLGESRLMLISGPKEKHLAPIIPVDKSIIELPNGEHYILLSDDEILQNQGLLMHLVAATKEEVEEIIDGNPVLQHALLEKVKNIVEKKPQWDFKSYDEDDIKDDDGRKKVLVEVVDTNRHQVGDDGDDDEIAIKNKQSKMGEFKEKLKDKASKLYRIGASLKGKVNAMKQKKKRKHNKSSHLPKLHVHVSTS